jgi:hypothetical protein
MKGKRWLAGWLAGSSDSADGTVCVVNLGRNIDSTRTARIPINDTFEKKTLLLFHVVGTVHLCKYWPFVRFSLSADKCETSQRDYK